VLDENSNKPWYKSEALSTALSVAAMIILAVLFKRASVPRA
jgi:hypothetical protein